VPNNILQLGTGADQFELQGSVHHPNSVRCTHQLVPEQQIWKQSSASFGFQGRYRCLSNADVMPANIICTSFRPVPTARHLLVLGRSSSTGHSLLGASPLDPLVHMFNPSTGTHLLSQSSKLYLFF
jgi:hypothetical protein